MKDVSDVIACCVDRGTFFPVAKALARGVKKVYYHHPNGETSETFARACLGYGHDEVELLSDDDLWLRKNEIDLFLFPDCMDGGWQLELQSQGFAVWGSKMAGKLETNRGKWMSVCDELGLPLPKTHRIEGVTNLQIFLAKNTDKKYWVKISRFRGDMETWKAKEPSQIKNKLDYLSMRFGPGKELITFYVQEEVETDIEGGADTYFVNGQWPDKVLLGYEKKGTSYFATWKDTSDMPEEIWGVNRKIEALLAEFGYANMISSEVRVADKKSFWIDPCFRFGSPAGEEELELYENFADIIWHGANGILEQPKMTGNFCGEAFISYDGDRDAWKSVVIPEDVRRWVKLYACLYDDGAFHFPPAQEVEAIGCAVAVGDTPTEVVDSLKDIAEQLKDSPVTLHITELADLFKEIEEAEEKGIEFSDQEIPEPSTVLDED